jgi:hypothetical protein
MVHATMLTRMLTKLKFPQRDIPVIVMRDTLELTVNVGSLVVLNDIYVNYVYFKMLLYIECLHLIPPHSFLDFFHSLSDSIFFGEPKKSNHIP